MCDSLGLCSTFDSVLLNAEVEKVHPVASSLLLDDRRSSSCSHPLCNIHIHHHQREAPSSTGRSTALQATQLLPHLASALSDSYVPIADVSDFTSSPASMLPRTRPVLSRISSLSHPIALPTSVRSRCFHSQPALSSSSLHSRSTQPRDASSPGPVSALDQEVNGWFLGELPGYKGDVLPGGASRFECRVYAWSMIISIAAFAYAYTSMPSMYPSHWAKEYVLNVEKFKAPEKALPFQKHDADEEEGQH